MQGLRSSLLGPNSSSLVDELIVQYEVKEHLDISRLAEDTEQMPALEMELRGVTRLQHLSLLREQQEGSRGVSGAEMVEVGSTVENLVQVAGAVAIGQPVLLVGEAGVGKTSLVRELADRTGKELLTLQVGFLFYFRRRLIFDCFVCFSLSLGLRGASRRHCWTLSLKSWPKRTPGQAQGGGRGPRPSRVLN